MEILDSVSMARWEQIYSLSRTMLGSEEQAAQMAASPIIYVRDLRTIHMGCGRQNGKTAWMVREMMSSPNQIMVVKDRAVKEFMVTHPALQGTRTTKEVKEHIFTLYDLRAMLRTKPDQAVAILNATKRVFIDDSSFQNTREVILLIAEHLPRNVVVVCMG